MNGCTAYMDTPNGERIELPATMPDVEEVPGPLSDEEKALIEMLENEFETFVAEFYTGRPLWKRRNLNIPERWEVVQDKRRCTSPLGKCSYLYKARKVKSLARSVHTRIAPHRGAKKGSASARSKSQMLGAHRATGTTLNANTMRKTMLLIQSIFLLWREISSPAPQKRGCFLYGAEHFL